MTKYTKCIPCWNYCKVRRCNDCGNIISSFDKYCHKCILKRRKPIFNKIIDLKECKLYIIYSKYNIRCRNIYYYHFNNEKKITKYNPIYSHNDFIQLTKKFNMDFLKFIEGKFIKGLYTNNTFILAYRNYSQFYASYYCLTF